MADGKPKVPKPQPEQPKRGPNGFPTVKRKELGPNGYPKHEPDEPR